MVDWIVEFLRTYAIGKGIDAALNWGSVEILNRVRRRSLSKYAQRIAHAFDRFSSRRVRPELFSIREIGRLPRGEIRVIQDAWNGGVNCLLLVGNAGSGKSGIAHVLAKSLRERGRPVLFVDAANVPSRQTASAFLEGILPLRNGLLDAFETLGLEQECFLIIDQLDSVSWRDSLLGFTNLITSLSALPGVRVLGVCRMYEADLTPEISALPCQRLLSAQLQERLALNYLRKLGISAPSQTILDLAVNLLNLSLIASVADAKGALEGIESETDLWIRYIESVREREGDDALKVALDLATQNPQPPDGEIEASLIPKRPVRRLISRGVLISPFLGRLRFRHERLRDFLCAYGLLPSRPTPIELHHRFGEHRGRAIVAWLHALLHKCDEATEARFVDDALTIEDGELPFYTRASVLDVLKGQSRPSDVVARSLAKHLHEEIYDKYFFEDLSNPEWLDPLHRIGYFYQPPDPVEVQPGYFRYPFWHAGAYLSRLAEKYPAPLVDVACKVKSQNAPALDRLLEGLVRLPPGVAAAAASSVATWASAFRGPFDPVRLGRFMGHLADGGHFHEALEILGSMISPVIRNDGGSEQRVTLRMVRAHANVDEYWLGEIWREHGISLVKRSPLGAAKTLEENLVRALELEQETYGQSRGSETPSYWRPAVEDHPQNTAIYPLHDLLVQGLRDAVQLVCLSQPERGHQNLDRYLASNHSILRRVAIFTLAEFGAVYEDLLTRVCSARANLDDHVIHHEYFWLLSKQFPQLPNGLKTQLVRWILEGPEDPEAIRTRIVEREGLEGADERLAQYREFWTIRRLWAIGPYLDADDKRRLDELCERLGKPDHPDFLSWSSGVQSISHISPLSQDELALIPLEEIIEVIKVYVPPSPSVVHSREGFAEALAGAVKANPARFVGLARLLADREVRLIYSYHYLIAIKEAVRRSEQLDPAPILDLCDYVASLQEDPHAESRDPDEPGMRAAQFAVASLVDTLIKQEKPTLGEGLESQIRTLIGVLLRNRDPDPATEMEIGWDPATRSLNCVRGQAMHSLISYARYRDKTEKERAGNTAHQPKLDPLVREVLEEKLDKSTDRSLAVHSVYGWYLPLIEYLDQEWLEANLAKIFPSEPESEAFWRAAWGAYVSFNHVYKRPFRLLIPHYHRAIGLLGEAEDPGRLGTTKAERLGEHLAFAYVHGVIDLDSEDALLQSFYAAAGDDVRAHVAFWLAKALGELALKSDDPLWSRMWNLMRWRLDVASGSGAIEGYQSEVSDFMRWLERAPLPFGEAEETVRAAVPFLKEGYHKKLVADYIARHSPEFPRQTIEILYELTLRWEAPWSSLYEEDLDAVIGQATRSDDKQAIAKAVEVINILGERGDFRWRKYLPHEQG